MVRARKMAVNLWNSLLRQALLNNFLSKDIDQYGLLHLTKTGNAFIDNPYSIRFVIKQNLLKRLMMMTRKMAQNKAAAL